MQLHLRRFRKRKEVKKSNLKRHSSQKYRNVGPNENIRDFSQFYAA